VVAEPGENGRALVGSGRPGGSEDRLRPADLAVQIVKVGVGARDLGDDVLSWSGLPIATTA
jgi:hypothetical protein